jgi:acetyl esterase/lipase
MERLMKLDFDRIDPELAVILPSLPEALADINRENVAQVREMMSAGPAEAAPTTVEIKERMIATEAVEQPDVRVLIHRRESEPSQPCVLWIHGGGYLFGSAEDDRARGIAEQLDCVVVSVDYRMAPEAPFPAGTEDCYSALLWIVANADELGVDPTRIAIGGASAGGGLAAGLALLNRDRGGPKLAMQLLLYPMIDNLHDTESGRITDHPVWNLQTSFNAWEMYLDGVPGEAASPYAAATRAKDLTGLPPAYICVGAEDLFRDEDINYARRLMAAGVSCELSVYPGMFHGSDSFMPTARVSQRLERGFISALGQALGA